MTGGVSTFSEVGVFAGVLPSQFAFIGVDSAAFAFAGFCVAVAGPDAGAGAVDPVAVAVAVAFAFPDSVAVAVAVAVAEPEAVAVAVAVAVAEVVLFAVVLAAGSPVARGAGSGGGSPAKIEPLHANNPKTTAQAELFNFILALMNQQPHLVRWSNETPTDLRKMLVKGQSKKKSLRQIEGINVMKVRWYGEFRTTVNQYRERF